MRAYYLLFFLAFILTLNSCVKNNPDPSWIEVGEWTISANPNLGGDEGELNHNITEAWVYINDSIIGVFEVPFKIPVLISGMSSIKIYPAIKNNGISATKKIYPFLDLYEVNAELIQNETLVINPTTQYKNNLTIWTEDFEDISIALEDDPNTSSANYQIANDDLQSFNGNYYGKVNLTSSDSLWVAYTTAQKYLPYGQEVYMEIDYKNDINVVTGLLAISQNGITNNPNIQLNAQQTTPAVWKKIYIDLRELISNQASGSYFEQSFAAQLDLENGQTSGEICIDNIKLIHF